MAARIALLPEIVRQMRTFFTEESYTHVVDIGWQASARQDNTGTDGADRIVFDLNGTKDKTVAPKGGTTRHRPNTLDGGGNVTAYGDRGRALCTVEWNIAVGFWAADRTTTNDPENEIAQIEAYVTMFEHATQAIHAYMHGAYQWADGEVPKQVIERAYGRAWAKTLVVYEDIFDVEYSVATPPVGAMTRELNQPGV